jgi:hypothetical protein
VSDSDARRESRALETAPAAPAANSAGAGVPALLILGAAGVAGAAVMGIELAAVRLLAPWFGTSLPVWTNVIGVLLLGLALGQALGAKLCRGDRPARRLGWVLLFGGLCAAGLPWLSDDAAGAFLPPELSLEAATGLLTWGSLAAAACLFLAPAIVLGAGAPLAVESLARSASETGAGAAGRAGGRVLAISTLGSLAGTFATTHTLLPSIGVRFSFLLFAGALGLIGTALILAGGGSRVGSAALLLTGGALGWGDLAQRELDEGLELLAQAESEYQRVRVLEDRRFVDDQGNGLQRQLQVNESSDSFQSVWQPAPGWLPEGYYYNDFALPLYWQAAEGDLGRPLELAVLGLGGGTAWRVLDGAAPAGLAWRSIGIELDPVVVELAQEFMDLPVDDPDREVVAGVDARVGLRHSDRSFDLVVLDCYANQVEIPPHLSSLEFFEELLSRLNDGGWLVANVGAFGLEDPVLQALGRTASEAFGSRALALRVPRSRNVSLFLRKGAALPDPEDERWIPDEAVLWLLAPREAPGAWRWIDANGAGERLTEDRNAILHLQQRSIAEAQRT